MILIHKVTCKNFLSYGNATTTFDLASHKSTLIRGKNGHGKSVILDLVLYALYGRPYRAINKPQLVNSINRGDMLVEIYFSIGATQYLVRRGIKPNVFDIFKDDILIKQDAAIRDYQDFLETQILKIPERTFKQIAVLGSASYVPFMKLAAWQRRELVESILDIEVFSKMNQILKERILSTKEEFSRITLTVDGKKREAEAQQKLINVIAENTNQRVDDHNQQKKILEKQLAEVQAEILKTNIDIMGIEDVEFDADEFRRMTDEIRRIEQNIKATKTRKKNIHTEDHCHACMQKVSQEHVEHVHKSLDKIIKDFEKEGKSYAESYANLLTKQSEYFVVENTKSTLNAQLATQTSHANSLQDQIISYGKTIIDILADTSNIETERLRLKEIAAEAMKLLARKNILSEEKHLQDVSQQLLKDSGIKTAVVREYLPVLNQLINKYLAMFDFFVDFNLDESFEEVIRSRGRDVFSYSSFSEGEKRRIDFAILMAFRQLAALKNSAKTNILILDEIVDGAFDLEARAAFNDLLVNIPHSNIIVISHADASTEQYNRVIQVEKEGDFSTYSVVE